MIEGDCRQLVLRLSQHIARPYVGCDEIRTASHVIDIRGDQHYSRYFCRVKEQQVVSCQCNAGRGALTGQHLYLFISTILQK